MNRQGTFERIYRLAVRLYPARFREHFGEDLVQLARDQWRERSTVRMRLTFAFKILGDLTSSLVQQHIEKQRQNMNNIPKNKLSLRLAILAISLSFIGVVAWQLGTTVAAVLLVTSSILLVARAVTEWQRPKGEWLRGLGISVLVFLAFGLIMPAWAKVTRLHSGDVNEQLAYLLMVSIFANLLVPALKPFTKAQA